MTDTNDRPAGPSCNLPHPIMPIMMKAALVATFALAPASALSVASHAPAPRLWLRPNPQRWPTRSHAALPAPSVARVAVAMCDEAKPSPPPLVLDRTAKLQLGILLLTNFLVQVGIGMIIVVLPLFAQSLGLGAAGVGLLIALPQLSKLLFNLPVGHLVDVQGRKPYLIAGALIDGAGQFATAASKTLVQLVPARLVIGVGTAIGSVTGPATMAYTQDVVGKYPEHSGLLLGALQAFGFLAFAAGPAIGGYISEKSGPALPFVIFGALQLATVPLKMLLPETLPASPEREEGESGLAAFRGLRSAMGGMMDSYRALLADRKQIALLGMK